MKVLILSKEGDPSKTRSKVVDKEGNTSYTGFLMSFGRKLRKD